MNAKEYLGQALNIDRSINSKLEQVASLHELATKAKEIFLPGVKLDQQMIHRIFRAITADNPHLYYFNQSCMNLGRTKFGDVLLPQYFCNKDQIDIYNGRVNECVSNIVYQLDLMNASEKEKLKRVHDYMAKNIVYDHEASHVSKEKLFY